MLITKELERKLEGIAEILDESKEEIKDEIKKEIFNNTTGFAQVNPYSLFYTIIALLKSEELTEKPISLDLGCGNGGFALMTAAMGFPSYGIDINSYLIDKARQNRKKALERGAIDISNPLEFAIGNIYPDKYIEDYRKFALKNRMNRTTMPLSANGNPYKKLEIEIKQASLIYSFPWMDQMPFLCRFLEKETSSDAVFVLPGYAKYGTCQSELKLRPIKAKGNMFFIGKRE